MLIAAPRSLRGNTASREFLQTVSRLTDPVDPDFVREFVRSTVTQPVSSAFLETAITECRRVPARVWQVTLSGLLEGDVPPTRESASVPLSLIWGDQDETCPLSQQQALMAAIPDASLAI